MDIVPQQVVAAGEAAFGLAWVPKALVSNEEGADLVNIAQVFQRSGTLEVSWADSGITSPADWDGKRVGTWGFGNEFELTAAIEKFDVTVDGELVQQPFDMSLLLNDELDAAQAMTYNEYAQVLESENPDTGELYTPEDLSVIDFNDPEVGTAMLQDRGLGATVVARRSGQPGHRRTIPARFLPGMDLLPGQLRAVRRGRARRRTCPRRLAPDVAAQRDQQADLAVAGRDRGDGPGPVGPDG